jgi:hypothetical protein
MDQLKEFLGLVKRQHFWFLAPILVALGVTGGIMASKKLSEEFDGYQSAVNGYMSKMQGVTSTDQHPNKEFHAGMQALISDRRENVREAWEMKWERQKEQLKWPEQLLPKFRQRVEEMRPIEKVDPTDVIARSLLASYASYIGNELPRLAAEIGAVWAPAQQRRRGGNNFARFRGRNQPRLNTADQADESQIVIWNPQNQALIKERFEWGSAPTTFEVLYAQEDLWVLASLIDIIKKTNAGAKTRSQAPVKQIDFIQIAQDVQDPGFRVIVPKPLGLEDGGDADVDPPPAVPATGSMSDQYSDETTSQQDDALSKLVANRYVNKDYAPIADLETLRTEVTVAKRIPVRLRIRMDQRHIYRLLVECANANLTFEVRQFRFNPRGEMLGAPTKLPRGRGTEPGLGVGNSNVKRLADYQSFDRTVELFGIVYIFNPVDDAVLGIEQDTDNLVTQR